MLQTKKVIFVVIGLVIAYIAVGKFLGNASPNSLDKENNSTVSNNAESNGESLVTHCAKKTANNIQYKRCQVIEGEFSEKCLKIGRDNMNLCMAGL